MAPKRQPHDLPPPSSESEDEEHSSSSDDSDSEPHQESSDSDDSDEETLKPPSPESKKPTSKPTQLKANGKRPAETGQQVSRSKKSKSVDKGSKSDQKVDKGSKSEKNVDKGLKSDKSKSVEKGLKSDENVDKGSKSDKSNSVDKGSKSDEKVDKGSKSDENVDKGSKSDKSKSVDKGSKSDEKVDKSSKRNKMSNGNGDDSKVEDKKAAFFTRLFTEKDEIVLLEGIIGYKENKGGADPSLNIAAFHESVENLLSSNVTRSQIGSKTRKLKKKFLNNVSKGQNGEDPVILKPHEYKLFELSKKIWGSEVRESGDSRVKSSGRKDKKDDNVGSKTPAGNKESDIEEQVMDKIEAETEDCWTLYPCLCASLELEAVNNFTAPISPKEYVKKVVIGLEKEKARELEKEWKGVVVMEQQVYAKRANMISKQAEAAMNAIHS